MKQQAGHAVVRDVFYMSVCPCACTVSFLVVITDNDVGGYGHGRGCCIDWFKNDKRKQFSQVAHTSEERRRCVQYFFLIFNFSLCWRGQKWHVHKFKPFIKMTINITNHVTNDTEFEHVRLGRHVASLPPNGSFVPEAQFTAAYRRPTASPRQMRKCRRFSKDSKLSDSQPARETPVIALLNSQREECLHSTN